MKILNSSYITFVLIHIIIGLLLFFFPFLSKVYSISILVIGLFVVLQSKNKNNEVLFVAAYIVGVEVLLRMTSGTILYEYAKYSVIVFMLLGMLYSGISRLSFPYWLFLLFLIPGVFYGIFQLNYSTEIRKAIAFNISGPVCLAISSIYCFQRKLSYTQLLGIIKCVGLPILATLVYVILYTPSVKEVVTGTYSNFANSGGYGPNQMSTILGLGMFTFFVLFLLNSKSKTTMLINLTITILMAYRGIVTFSRGGLIAALIMIVVLLIITMLKLKKDALGKFSFFIIMAGLLGFFVWSYSSIQTGGLIDKRYANQDARGREKESVLTGRETLIASEIEMFLDNPITGVGVGKNKEYREETLGIEAASHNEVTRMLAEQGIFGVFCMLILILTPALLFLTSNKNNLFLIPFYIFWALTISHAAMRLAAPAFIYALTLLNVIIYDENRLHRQQAK